MGNQLGKQTTTGSNYPNDNEHNKGMQHELADVIYIFTDKNKPGIMLYQYSNSEEYIDAFRVNPNYDKIEWNDELPEPGKVVIANLSIGSRQERTFFVSEEEFIIILTLLEKNKDKETIILDMKEILSLKKEKYNENNIGYPTDYNKDLNESNYFDVDLEEENYNKIKL